MSKQEFKGKCLGVRLDIGTPNCSTGVLVTLMVEDDEQWLDKLSFDAFWLEEMGQQIARAHDAHMNIPESEKQPDEQAKP